MVLLLPLYQIIYTSCLRSESRLSLVVLWDTPRNDAIDLFGSSICLIIGYWLVLDCVTLDVSQNCILWKREKLTLLKNCYQVVRKSFSCARALSHRTLVPSTHVGTPEFHPGPMWQRALMKSAQCMCVLENTIPSCVFVHNCSIVSTRWCANFLSQKKWENGIPLLNVASVFSLTKYR